MYFSTQDNDNDNSDCGNCAITTESGWWYGACDSINLNEQPIEYIKNNILTGEMKIRPKD